MAESNWRLADWQTAPSPKQIIFFQTLQERCWNLTFADKCLNSDLLIKKLQENLHVSLWLFCEMFEKNRAAWFRLFPMNHCVGRVGEWGKLMWVEGSLLLKPALPQHHQWRSLGAIPWPLYYLSQGGEMVSTGEKPDKDTQIIMQAFEKYWLRPKLKFSPSEEKAEQKAQPWPGALCLRSSKTPLISGKLPLQQQGFLSFNPFLHLKQNPN